MARQQNRRLRPQILQADRDVLTALQSFDDYRPQQPACTSLALAEGLAAMQTARQVEQNLRNALSAARDAANAAEWQFHNLVLEAKNQVRAQYGANSDQLQALGLKKKSEHKQRTRRNQNT